MTLRPSHRIRVWLAIMAGCCGLTAGSVVWADEPAPSKINYEEHVKPILREHCFLCHNQNQAKSDLALDGYGSLMRGGAGGEVVVPGNLDESRLWLLVTHQDSPEMPPEKDKLPEELLNVIRQWIEGGALETAGSVAKAKAKPKPKLEMTGATGAARPEGPAAMPEGLPRQPAVYTPRAAAITALAASPWAPLVAVAGQEQVALYHTETAELLGILPFPEGVPYVLKFSRSGALLLAGGGRGGHSGRVVVFDVKSGRRVFEVGDELDAVLAADINEDHTRIALGGPQRVVRIFDTADGQQLHEIRKHTDWVYALEFSPDGVLLATADRGGGLFVWEAETAREYQNLKGHTAGIHDLSWRSDSNVLASAGDDGSIRLWEMENGGQIKSFSAHGGVLSLEFAVSGQLVTAGRDRIVRAWDQNGQQQREFEAFGDLALEAVMTHDAGRVIAGDWSGEVRMWNVADGARLANLPANPPTLEIIAQQTAAEAEAAQTAADAAAAELAALETQLAGAANEAEASARQAAEAAQAVAAAEAARAAAAKLLAEAAAKLQAAAEQFVAAQAALTQATQQKLDVDRTLAESVEAALAAAEAAKMAQAQAAKTAEAKSQAEAALAAKAEAVKQVQQQAAQAQEAAAHAKAELEAYLAAKTAQDQAGEADSEEELAAAPASP